MGNVTKCSLMFSETASKVDSNIESALDSDMAMRGATLTQSELDSQGGNSVVAILSKVRLDGCYRLTV